MMSSSRLNCSWSWGRYSWSKPRSREGFTFCTSERFVSFFDVALDDGLELLGDAGTFQRNGLPAVDVDRSDRDFTGAGQADADVGVLGFARTVDHAAHHGDSHRLHSRVLRLPDRHLRSQKLFDALRKLLENRARGSSAARARAHHGRKRAQ